MNRIYKVIFNRTLGVFQVACEFIKANGQSKSIRTATQSEDSQLSKFILSEVLPPSKLVNKLNVLFITVLCILSGKVYAAEHITTDTTITSPEIHNDDVWLDGGGTFVVNITGSSGLLETTIGSNVNEYSVSIGQSAGTHATVNVENGGTLTSGGKLFVGRNDGTGILNINAGGTVNAKTGGNIGAVGNTSSGVVNIKDGGIFNNYGELHVGGLSTGTLNIETGGVFNSTNSFIGVGMESGGNGTVNVDGKMTLSGGISHLEIASKTGSMGSVNVRNGGKLEVGGYVLVGNQGQGNIKVSGNNSSLNATGTGSFRVGLGSAGNGQVDIDSGGQLKVNGNVLVGVAGSGSINIFGTDSKFLSTGTTSNFGIGTGSGTGAITVGDGGILDVATSKIDIGTSSGTGTLNIGAAKNTTAINAGTLAKNNNINLGADGSLVFNHTSSGYLFVSSIEGSGNIFQENSTTILSGDNDNFSGSTSINGGVLQIGNNGATGSIGSSDLYIASGAQADVHRTGTLTISGKISGSGEFIHSGTGTTILTGLNSYSGGTRVLDGTLQGNTDSLQGNIINNSNLIFNQIADGIYAGNLTGAGTLRKDGSSALTLQNNAYSREVFVDDGTLNIGSDSTLAVTGGNMTMSNGTKLGVDISSTPAVDIQSGSLNLTGNNTINITGYNPVTDNNTYTLVSSTSGINGSFNTTIAGAALSTYVTEDIFLIGSAKKDATGNNIVAELGLVWNNTDNGSAHGTFNIIDGEHFNIGVALADNTDTTAYGFGWNGKDLKKTGAGTLILNNHNTYTGQTDIQMGTLIVGETSAYGTAQISGPVEVQNGATLGGHGRIAGTVNIHNGGTLSPGNSIGTLTVADAVFGSGSTYLIEANPDGTADKLVADSSLGGTGTVTIDPTAGLDIKAGSGNWNSSTRYLIIDTDGGVTGQFGTVDSNLVFLTEMVDYNNPDQVWLTFTRNDVGFDDLDGSYNQNQTGNAIEGLEDGNKIYDTIIGMDRDQALDAFDNLSGEIYASTQSALLNNSRYARDAIKQHLGGGIFTPTLDDGKALWVNTWYHDGYLKNDGNAAKTDNQGYGILVGSDIYQNENLTLGAAIGYERTELKVGSNRRSENNIDALHLLGYSRLDTEWVTLKSGIGFSWLNADSTRHIEVKDISEKQTADYDGQFIQVFTEGSHTIELNDDSRIAPYVGLVWQQVKFDSFTENGDGVASLHHGSKSTDQTLTTLGVRGSYDLGESSTLYADIGWQHTLGKTTPNARLNFAGASTYNLKGVKTNLNEAIIGLGASFALTPKMSISAGYEGAFGDQSRDHAAKIMWQLKF